MCLRSTEQAFNILITVQDGRFVIDWLDGTTSKKLPHELMSSMSRDLDPAQYDEDDYWEDGEPDPYVSLLKFYGAHGFLVCYRSPVENTAMLHIR